MKKNYNPTIAAAVNAIRARFDVVRTDANGAETDAVKAWRDVYTSAVVVAEFSADVRLDDAARLDRAAKVARNNGDVVKAADAVNRAMNDVKARHDARTRKTADAVNAANVEKAENAAADMDTRNENRTIAAARTAENVKAENDAANVPTSEDADKTIEDAENARRNADDARILSIDETTVNDGRVVVDVVKAEKNKPVNDFRSADRALVDDVVAYMNFKAMTPAAHSIRLTADVNRAVAAVVEELKTAGKIDAATGNAVKGAEEEVKAAKSAARDAVKADYDKSAKQADKYVMPARLKAAQKSINKAGSREARRKALYNFFKSYGMEVNKNFINPYVAATAGDKVKRGLDFLSSVYNRTSSTKLRDDVFPVVMQMVFDTCRLKAKTIKVDKMPADIRAAVREYDKKLAERAAKNKK